MGAKLSTTTTTTVARRASTALFTRVGGIYKRELTGWDQLSEKTVVDDRRWATIGDGRRSVMAVMGDDTMRIEDGGDDDDYAADDD
jgi:hypothetical protein